MTKNLPLTPIFTDIEYFCWRSEISKIQWRSNTSQKFLKEFFIGLFSIKKLAFWKDLNRRKSSFKFWAKKWWMSLTLKKVVETCLLASNSLWCVCVCACVVWCDMVCVWFELKRGDVGSNKTDSMGSLLSFYCTIFCYIKYRWR